MWKQILALTAALAGGSIPLDAGGDGGSALPQEWKGRLVCGPAVIKDDFENCRPTDAIRVDENVPGCWNLRTADWPSKLLYVQGAAPDIVYDPALKGYYDVYVESRATHFDVRFALRFSSDADFTAVEVPHEGATPDRHWNVDVPVRRQVKMDGETITIRSLGEAVYIEAFRFVPLGSDPMQPLKVTKDRDVVICREAGRHFAFPGVAALPDGELLVVFREGATHVSPDGAICLARSADAGRTWGPREVIYDDPNVDERDPSVLQMPDGTTLVNFAGAGSQIITSHDGGRTWSPPTTAPVFAPHGPVLDEAGRLVYVGLVNRGEVAFIEAHRSADGGQTWQMLSPLISMPEYRLARSLGMPFYDEPHAAILPPDRWLVLYRMDTTDDYLTLMASDNGGARWRWPVPTPMRGHPAHLLRLRSGALLCVYGYRHPPFGIRGSVSYDGGWTWQPEFVLRDDGGDTDLGYPASVELPDGKILTVYYFNHTGSGGRPEDVFVAGTVFTVER
jgi:sialidase-1